MNESPSIALTAPQSHTQNGGTDAMTQKAPIPPRHLLAALGVIERGPAGAPELRFPGHAAALPGGDPVYDPAAEDGEALSAYVEALRLESGERASAWRPRLVWTPGGGWRDLRPVGETGPAPQLPDYLLAGLGIVRRDSNGETELRFPGWSVAAGSGAATYHPHARTARDAAREALEGLPPLAVAELRAWRPRLVWNAARGRWEDRRGEETRIPVAHARHAA